MPAKTRTSRVSRLSEKIRASQSSLDGSLSTNADALAETCSSHGGLATVISLLAKVSLFAPPPSKHTALTLLSDGSASIAAPGKLQLRSGAVAPRASVQERSEEELAALQDGSPEATAKLRVMAVAAEIVETLADTQHAKLLVAQGGLLAVAKVLSWNLRADINTACAMVVYKLVHKDAGYLQMVRLVKCGTTMTRSCAA